jgi:hypothetical protein
MKDIITLSRNEVMWFATFSDPKVTELFFTDTIATPFKASVPAATVMAEIEKRNPDSRVVISAWCEPLYGARIPGEGLL